MAREFLTGIKSENRLSKVRLIMPNDPVIGGQPSDNADEFTSNTPFLDLACSIQYAITQAANAQTAANQAKTAADNAQKTANEAKTAAATADSKAVAAQNTANTANTAAKNADTKAANAQTSANQAKTAADNARRKADQVPNPAANRFVVGNTTTSYKLMTAENVKILLGVPEAQKLYSGTGQATDGAMTQKAATDVISALNIDYALVDFGVIDKISRYVKPNPFGNHVPVMTVTEVEVANGVWAVQNIGWHSVQSATGTSGANGGFVLNEGLVVVTGAQAVAMTSGQYHYGALLSPSANLITAKCRMHVWRLKK